MEEEEGRGKGKRKNAHEQANRTKLGRRKKTVRMRSGAEWSEVKRTCCLVGDFD